MTRAAIDTSALLALASSRDQYHARAVQADRSFRAAGGRWLSTTLVLSELHGHLLRRLDPGTSRQVIDALLNDPLFEWHDASVEMVQGAIARWMNRYADQRFSLTDAVSFELMRREKVNRAFAYDSDFTTAGYQLIG
ncbi:MAG: PIN domain-containing protein [Gemmatimonadota bacterium]|nr:PIN domain-containing protein [Gemmatimonadota bacterium]